MKNSPTFLIAALVFSIATWAQTPTTTIAITGGKLLTVSHGAIENGILLIANGKISAIGEVGKVTVPPGATIVDAHGMTVYPGLIDPDTTLAAWAREQQTPVLYASDVDQKVGKLYGAISGKMDDRSLFVIDPAG